LGEAGEDVAEDAPKPVFAPLPEGTKMDSVTLEDALPMFKLPRLVGKTAEGEEIMANIGRFGPYVQVGKLFVSIKGTDPMEISEEKARELIKEKQEKERKRVIAEYGKIKVLNGPYGPYVTDGKTNAKIPKEVKPNSITEAKAKKLLADAPKRPKRRFRRAAQTS
jgi:DNA topoisomerase-1